MQPSCASGPAVGARVGWNAAKCKKKSPPRAWRLEAPLDTLGVYGASRSFVECAVVGPYPIFGVTMETKVPVRGAKLTNSFRIVFHLEEWVPMESASMGGIAPVGIVVPEIEMGAAHFFDVVPIWPTPLPLLSLEILGYCRNVFILLHLQRIISWDQKTQFLVSTPSLPRPKGVGVRVRSKSPKKCHLRALWSRQDQVGDIDFADEVLVHRKVFEGRGFGTPVVVLDVAERCAHEGTAVSVGQWACLSLPTRPSMQSVAQATYPNS